MAQFLSPGIKVTEIDRSQSVASQSFTNGGFAGVFAWGPVGQVSLVLNEDDLYRKYGPPSDFNGETWFSAANFLKYSNQLYVSRAVSNAVSAIANTGFANNETNTIKNDEELEDFTFDANVNYVARYVGDIGNSLKVSQCDNANQYSSVINLAANVVYSGPNTHLSISVGSNVATVSFANNAALANDAPIPYIQPIHSSFIVGDVVRIGNNSIGTQALKITSISPIQVQNASGVNTGAASFTVSFNTINKLSQTYSSAQVNREWEYKAYVNRAPGTSQYQQKYGNTAVADELHVVVVDEDGKFGTPGAILEVYSNVSRATDAKNDDSSTNYYKDVINQKSAYIYAASDRVGAASATAANLTPASGVSPLGLSFVGGTDGDDEASINVADLATAWDLYKSAEDIDVTLLFTGKARGGTNGEQLSNYIIDNICEPRMDSIVFCSPEKEDVVKNPNAVLDVIEWADSIRSSSYAALDCNYKYQYDKYNDKYRWIPVNADVAGCMVNKEPWESPAGINRGQIKNVTKLAWNPTQEERDILYPARVNPVVTLKGQGTVLYGDKTALAYSSAFDRINVRHLFIYVEKSIKVTCRGIVFELNNDATRNSYVNAVTPFLRTIKGAGGITDFKVVCDASNNTGDVIDANKFVAQNFIKPSRSINFVDLQFIAVGTSTNFSEVVL